MTVFEISLVMPRLVRAIHGPGLNRTSLAENEARLAFPPAAAAGTLSDPQSRPVPPV
jgi:hypothetical protein